MAWTDHSKKITSSHGKEWQNNSREKKIQSVVDQGLKNDLKKIQGQTLNGMKNNSDTESMTK